MAYQLGPISITGSAVTVVGAFEVTGSITSTQTLQVTASSATNALTASYVTSSNVVGTVTSASYALTSSYATNAATSYAPISTTGSTIYTTSPATSNISSTAGIFLGSLAGNGGVNANYSIFLGLQAGQGATNADESVFIGPLSALGATRANGSVFLGSGAGQYAASASYSTLIGYYAGSAANTSLSIGTNNIILGNNITLPRNTQNAINIGAIIFATGSYSLLGAGNLYSGSVMGRVGINISNPQYNFDVSGSGNYSNGLTVSGSLNAPSTTGSLQGTASWAQSASQAVSSSYAVSAGNASTIDINSFGSDVSSYLLMSNVIATTGVAIGGDTDLRYNASTNRLTATNITSTTLTGSLQGTASWADNAVTASFITTAQTASYVVTAQTASYVTSSNIVGTVTSASYALNGGVTQIVAGTNITISPTNGLGAVTINSSGGSGGAGANITASFTNQSTWIFTHALNNRGVVVQTFDTNWNQIIPENITLTDTNIATITFPTNESGFAIATLGGVTSIVNASSSISASFASTASSVNTLNQNVIISGSLTVGQTTTGASENTLTLAAKDNGSEGGQLGFNAPGGTYTSASFIDNFANKLRILAGPSNAGSTAELIKVELSNGNTTLNGGSIIMPTRPAFRVSGSSVTGIAASTVITSTQGAVVDYNQGDHYNNTTGTFTAPLDGLYQVFFNCRTQTAGGQQVIIYKNTNIAQMMWETNSNTGHFGISSILRLAANDTLQARVTVGTVQFDSNDNWGAAYIG